MKDKGWIKLHRKLILKPIWKNSTPEQKALLISILLKANHEEKEWDWGGNKFKAKKGEFVTSAQSLCNAAGKGVSRQNVRTAIARFKKMDFLTIKSTKHGMLISVTNWDTYQAKAEEPNHTPNQGVTKDQPRGNQGVTTNKNDKNYKNVKKRPKPLPDFLGAQAFDDFWTLYPKKKSKGQARRTWDKIKPTKETISKIMSTLAIAKKSEDWTKNNGQYIPYPSSWLNDEGWNDEYHSYQEEPTRGKLKDFTDYTRKRDPNDHGYDTFD